MNRGRKLLGQFLMWTVAYGFVAFAIVFMTAIRTCGMSPDSVEMCDLTTLTVVQAGLGCGYLAFAVYFYRTRVAGRV